MILIRLVATGVGAASGEGGDSPKVGRNDPCPCGSGKKLKNVMERQLERKTTLEDAYTYDDVLIVR